MIDFMRREEHYFNPIEGTVKDNNNNILGYIDFNESENYYMYRDEYGNIQLISKSGSIWEHDRERTKTYKEWKYYE